MGKIFTKYFQDMYTTSNPSYEILHRVTLPRLAPREVDLLNEQISDDEIKDTVWNLGAWKVLGLDGIQIRAFLRFWRLFYYHIIAKV